jgi:hypothetical protein
MYFIHLNERLFKIFEIALLLITVAASPRRVFYHSSTLIVRSNPTRDMDAYIHFVRSRDRPSSATNCPRDSQLQMIILHGNRPAA